MNGALTLSSPARRDGSLVMAAANDRLPAGVVLLRHVPVSIGLPPDTIRRFITGDASVEKRMTYRCPCSRPDVTPLFAKG